ncbi:uncharacterized protein GLRG_04705 [Colletotrichum graminicola M1.001]|uniref:Uncharacterized protein n=1 Tax=Colletotrichum graminicola (strain M1.001 / M2 / FGSC 10212) TaxID=645133 RepID=E3QFC3_COLGM|nr:uncharacterized protein GLRG_04705 [Colletotrichum graminicola M1.001]EFQ29561.1 hypothetical protein GLRG_04705 [Colletotrichum graminicola M1.001]
MEQHSESIAHKHFRRLASFSTAAQLNMDYNSNLPPWATLNSTVASITGTVSIPVLNSSTVTATVFSSSLVASFPWNNATFSHPLTGTLTVSLITVNTTVRPPSSTNSTVLPTTEIGTSSLTSTGPPLTLVPPLPTGNSTLISGPTWVRTSSILLSTGVTTVSTDMTVTSTDSPPLPTANSTSSLVATRPATVTVSGSVITLISTLTGVPATLTGSVTGTPISPTLPPYPTTNSTVLSGPTAGGTEQRRRDRDKCVLFGHLGVGVELSLLIASFPQFDPHLRRSVDNSSNLEHIRNRIFFFVYTACTYASTFELICGCSALFCYHTIVHFLENFYFYGHIFLIQQQFAHIAICVDHLTNGTVTQVVTRSVLVTTATASANPTVAYPPLSTNTTVALSRTLCTSKWQNLTSTTSAAGFKSTWTSLVLTNRTSSSLDRATTFITSTTTRSGDPGGGDDGFPSESTFVFGTPTTTITDAPLPSNTAYPWGGLGPIFRPHEKAEPKTGGAYLPKLKDGKAHAA